MHMSAIFRLHLLAFALFVSPLEAAAPADNDLAALEKADVLVEGPATPKQTVYVFFDPNCLYCNLTWKALQPYERQGLQVRWVPVAYQKETSATRVAAIFGAKDRLAAFRENERHYREASYDGGIRPARAVMPELAAALNANLKLMQRFGAPGTPALVWRDGRGSVRVKVGRPSTAELQAIARGE